MNKKKFITSRKTWGGFIRPEESPGTDLLVRTFPPLNEPPPLKPTRKPTANGLSLRSWLSEKKLLAGDSQRKSEFLAQFSHEIRTPLYGVVGTASLLATTSLTEEQRFYVDTLQDASKNLMRMIDEILDFSKFENGSLELARKKFSLHELSRNILALYGGMAQSKSLALTMSLDGAMAENFIGDGDRLRRVVMNLFSNALKYTSEGGVILRWKVLQETRSHQILRCEIEDSGPGIPEEAQKMLFRPFYRVEGASLATDGTGLGLSISKMIVEKLQGQIGVIKAAEKGSIFWFEIPLAKCHNVETRDSVENASEKLLGGGFHMDLSFFKILVAEDNPINQKILAKMFEKMGILYTLVSDGQSVLAALEQDRFDLVMVDFYMTPMNGFEATQKIRASGQAYAKIPIIAFTASTSENDQQKWRQVGMDDCILKPATQEQLQAKIEHWAHKIYDGLAVLDEVSLEKIRSVDDAEQTLLKALGEIYSGHTGEEVEALGQLIQEGSLDLAQRKAHKLKSSAAQLGAWRFEKYCQLMEHEQGLTTPRAQKLYKPLREEYRLSCQKLIEKCQNSSQS